MATSYERWDDPQPRIDPAPLTPCSSSLRKPLRRTFCKIRQNAIGTGALDAHQCFQCDCALVEPAVARGGHDHGVLAADLVDQGRHSKPILDPPHNVQVG